MASQIDGSVLYRLRKELLEILKESIIKHGKVGNRRTDQISRDFERGPSGKAISEEE